MTYASRNFLFLNIGHALDHFFMLIFATAVLSASMKGDFEGSYGTLLLLTTLSFLFFGGASLPAGWLGDKWSRHRMIVVFFIGIGAASIFTGLSTGRLGIQIGLAMIGILAAIYHPIGSPWWPRKLAGWGEHSLSMACGVISVSPWPP